MSPTATAQEERVSLSKTRQPVVKGEETHIGSYIAEPQKASESARAFHHFCSCPGQCPLLAQGQCLITGGLFGLSKCVYGSIRTEITVTKRSRKYWTLLSALRARVQAGPKLPKFTCANSMRVIGDYVHLPYAQMNHADIQKRGVPFVGYSAFFSGGSPFIHRDDFTPEVVVVIAAFRPYALMGGEITSYQKESVPLFLYHLRLTMPDLYRKASEIDPGIVSKTFNPENIPLPMEARLQHMPAGQTEGWVLRDLQGRHGTPLSWDGETMKVRTHPLETIYNLAQVAGAEGYEIVCRPDPSKIKILVTDKDLAVSIALRYPDSVSTEVMEGKR